MQFGNEEIAITIILGTGLILFFAVIIIFLFILFNNKNKLNLHDKEMAKKNFEENLLQTRLEIREQTLRNIGYELHDNLGQTASLIKINQNTIKFDDRHAPQEKTEEAKALVRELIYDLKSLSMSLNSDRISQLGIVKGVQEEIQRLNKTGQFKTELQVNGPHPEINANNTIILFRMMQEMINNVVKHSGASNIAITITSTENLCTFVCRDDGVGFNLDEKIRGGSGAGLIRSEE